MLRHHLGGGTAGLPLAVRLAETTGVRVGVLEAGTRIEDDPLLDEPRMSCRLKMKTLLHYLLYR